MSVEEKGKLVFLNGSNPIVQFSRDHDDTSCQLSTRTRAFLRILSAVVRRPLLTAWTAVDPRVLAEHRVLPLPQSWPTVPDVVDRTVTQGCKPNEARVSMPSGAYSPPLPLHTFLPTDVQYPRLPIKRLTSTSQCRPIPHDRCLPRPCRLVATLPSLSPARVALV
jgi:hypothetical protein